MSSRTLIVTVVCVVLLAAGGVGLAYSKVLHEPCQATTCVKSEPRQPTRSSAKGAGSVRPHESVHPATGNKSRASTYVPDSAPAAGGYFTFHRAGTALPSEATCATKVRRSTWEPRPQNTRANYFNPPSSFIYHGYVIGHPDAIWARVNGRAVGTTDELIQYYACKWGLSDNVMRAQSTVESNWFQDLKGASGRPVPNAGYGDYGACPGGPYGPSGPGSLGILQIKWCVHGTPPLYTERSTAFNLDYYGAKQRACVNGWDYLTTTKNDMWGCVGAWYTGAWHDSGAESYVLRVKETLRDKPWQSWEG